VLEVDRGARIVATHRVDPRSFPFAHHFPLRPVLPGSLLLECIAQVGGLLLEASWDFERKALPAYFMNAKFRRAVLPGDVLRIEVTVESWNDGGAVLQANVRQQDEHRCATAVLGMITAPLAGFFGPEHLGPYRALYARSLTGCEARGFDRHPAALLDAMAAAAASLDPSGRREG
jgi:3-hydroxymyristoyl/3-hydroxydecanoyl-(acyl carrier protein) dehydratase